MAQINTLCWELEIKDVDAEWKVFVCMCNSLLSLLTLALPSWYHLGVIHPPYNIAIALSLSLSLTVTHIHSQKHIYLLCLMTDI